MKNLTHSFTFGGSVYDTLRDCLRATAELYLYADGQNTCEFVAAQDVATSVDECVADWNLAEEYARLGIADGDLRAALAEQMHDVIQQARAQLLDCRKDAAGARSDPETGLYA